MAYVAMILNIVGTPDPSSLTPSQKSSSISAIVMIYLCSFEWALGWNGIHYLINAEIYPLHIRAIFASLIMMLHFVNKYGANRAVPLMLLPLSQGGMALTGAFWFFVAVSGFSALWAWLSIPEMSGLSLESRDRLFTLPWYQIGSYGQSETRVLQNAHDKKVDVMTKRREIDVHVEKI